MASWQARKNMEQVQNLVCYSPVSEDDYDEEDGYIVIGDEQWARWVGSSIYQCLIDTSSSTCLSITFSPTFAASMNFVLQNFQTQKENNSFESAKTLLTQNFRIYRMVIRPNMSHQLRFNQQWLRPKTHGTT